MRNALTIRNAIKIQKGLVNIRNVKRTSTLNLLFMDVVILVFIANMFPYLAQGNEQF